VNELALGYPEGRIELQLIGGFRDQQGYAEDLYSNIMREYSERVSHFVISAREKVRRVITFMYRPSGVGGGGGGGTTLSTRPAFAWKMF
jgi:Protein N-terminal asparagine amidohydrolase